MSERKGFSFMNSYYDMISDQSYEVQCDFLYNLARFQLGAVTPEFKTNEAKLLWRGHHYTIERSLKQYVIKRGIPQPDWAKAHSTPHSTPHSIEQVEEQEQEQEQVEVEDVNSNSNSLNIFSYQKNQKEIKEILKRDETKLFIYRILKGYNPKEQDIFMLMDKFIDYKAGTEFDYKNHSDIARNFISWIPKEIERLKSKPSSKKQVT